MRVLSKSRGERYFFTVSCFLEPKAERGLLDPSSFPGEQGSGQVQLCQSLVILYLLSAKLSPII